MIERTALFERVRLQATVYSIETPTFYARFGDWPAWLALGTIAAGVGYVVVRPGTPRDALG